MNTPKPEIPDTFTALESIDFEKMEGLIPVITQDASTKQVLMLAYANKEAILKTVETGYAHYYSRSRRKLWMKGETSGHTQKIAAVMVDCDGDALLYMVQQTGPACHTGSQSCFFRTVTGEQ